MKHTIELQPFTVPNFARPVARPGKRQDGFVETPAIPLAELDTDTLDTMCAEFRKAVFAKAGKVPNAKLSGGVAVRLSAGLETDECDRRSRFS